MSESKEATERAVMEGLILSKLYRDGFMTVDEENKSAEFDCRKDALSKKYGEDSFEDIRSIIERTSEGMESFGYSVRVRYIDQGAR